MPKANTVAMQSQLDLVSKQVPKGWHAVVVLDRAGWHTTRKLKQYSNVPLLFLPPASPELNPSEQVWQQLRDRYLANRCYTGYIDIVDSSCQAWNEFIGELGRIKRLCTKQ